MKDCIYKEAKIFGNKYFCIQIGKDNQLLIYDKGGLCAELYRDRLVNFTRDDLPLCILYKIKETSDYFDERYEELDILRKCNVNQ